MSALLRRSPSVGPPCAAAAEFVTISHAPVGTQSSGAMTAAVPVKPLGAMPTIVNGRPFTDRLRPMSDALAPRFCQYS